MQLSFYSCLMAMIASSAMIVVIYFLKKIKYFNNTFGVAFMAMLYLLSLVRLFVPIELPQVQVISDSVVLTKIMDVLENRSPLTAGLPCSMLHIFGSLSFLVTLILLLAFTIKQLRFVLSVVRTKNYATKKEQKMLKDISREVFGRKTMMRLIKSRDVSSPMVVGVLRSTVIIPDKNYKNEELELILYHECTHLKNHDLWLKLLVHIYCCVYWFNPIVYLLKSDIDFLLEVKCDSAVCRRLSEEKKLDYAKLVNDTARDCVVKRKRGALVTFGFASTSTLRHICRMNSMLKPKTKKPLIPTAIVLGIMIVICMASYLFIWQPDYSNSKDAVADINGAYGTTVDNGYLVPNENGDYILHIEKNSVVVPKDDVEKGYYDNYPIVKQ